MPDPMPPTDANAAQPAPAPAAPPEPAQPQPTPAVVDPAEIRALIGLPPEAPDAVVIQTLAQVLTVQQEKYDELAQHAAELQDNMANRQVSEFSDIISPEHVEYWKGQFIANAAAATAALKDLRNRAARPSPPPAPVAPLRTRLADTPPTVQDLVGGPKSADAVRANLIRNRAHHIRKTEGVSWYTAFTRAAKETR